MPDLRLERLRGETEPLLGLRDDILQVPRVRKKGQGSREMVKTDLEALRMYFRDKFREMGIDPLPLEEPASPSKIKEQHQMVP